MSDESNIIVGESQNEIEISKQSKKKKDTRTRKKNLQVPVTPAEEKTILKNRGKKGTGAFLRDLGLRNKFSTVEHVYKIDSEIESKLDRLNLDATNGGKNFNAIREKLLLLFSSNQSTELQAYIADLADPIEQIGNDFSEIRKEIREIKDILVQLSVENSIPKKLGGDK